MDGESRGRRQPRGGGGRGDHGGGGTGGGRAARRGGHPAWRGRARGRRRDRDRPAPAVPRRRGTMSDGRTPRIVVVGSANIDQLITADRLPESGETVFGTGFHQGFGGKGANQAVAAARLGADVVMVA